MERVSTMPRGGISFAHPADLSAVVNQNRMKLRVNRVAIVQDLKAEHVVGHLARTDVLSPDEMRRVCTDEHNPVAVLLDILACKENRTQWYAQFLHALRHAEVDHEQKRRYRRLVDFLENTIIRFPAKHATPRDEQFTRYQPLPEIQRDRYSSTVTPHGSSTTPGHVSITSHGTTPGHVSTTSHNTTLTSRATPGETETETPQTSTTPRHQGGAVPHQEPETEVAIVQAQETGSPGMTLISGHYHQWVPSPISHASRLPDPAQILISLETADDPAFHEQIKAEKLALHRMKELEVLYIMHRQKRLPEGFILCMADCVTQIVDDVENHHLYVKYLMTLKSDYNLYIVKELVGSYTNWLMATKLGDVQKNADLLARASKFGLNLFDLLDELADYVCAEAVISVLTMWLMVQPCLETWIHGYTACIRLARIRIRNFEFTQADKALNSAIQYLNAIKLMSFGQNFVDESEKMVATSWLMHELGSHEAAYHWAHDGLKEVRTDNKHGIINALCNGVRCYASTFNMRRAHELAVEAVRQASEYFGRVHPMFIKARLTYIELVTEFSIKNDQALKLAMDTLKRCELIYHCDSMLLARAHLAASNAYITAGKLADESYVKHASKAQRTAMNCVNGMHPILAVFSEQLAKCSFLKSRVVPKPAPDAETLSMMKMTQLIFAASELSVAYRIYCPSYGTHSYRAATAQIVLADILVEEGNYEDAKVMYEDALGTYNICLRKRSPYLGQLQSKVAKFYYDRGDLARALGLMDAVILPLVKNGQIVAGPIRLQWMENMFQLYIKAISDLNDDERLQTTTELRDAWREKTELLVPLSLAELAKKPEHFSQFQKSFMLWQKVKAKVAAFGKGTTSDSEEESEGTLA